ncbi:MAG: DUF6116 family protein [Halioglobus sp.]|nr:DUF6116 family protein [Halioglobus sp.]
MAIGKLVRAGLPGVVLKWGARLRFPWLFLLTAVLFVIDLLVPDVIPLVDEILIGLVTLLLANLKKKPEPPALDASDAGKPR